MKKNILRVLAFGLVCLAGGALLAGCGQNEKKEDYNPEIYAIYTMAQENGYTGTYEEWLESIKGEKGDKGATGDNIELRVFGGYIQWKTTSDSIWQNLISIDSLKGNKGDPGDKGDDGKDATYETYTVTYDYGAAQDFFDNNINSTTIKSTQWITNLPTIKEECEDAFIGWFIAGTNKQVEKFDFIGGNVTLEARFDFEKGISGLYQNGKYVKTWQEIKNTYSAAFDGTRIVKREGDVPFNYVSHFKSLSGDLVVDNEITEIYINSFEYCADLTGVVIPGSVASISNNAFAHCTSLTNAIIEKGVVNIYDGAFQYCTSLTSVAIPESVTGIGSWAFQGCTSLTSVVIPNGVTRIYREAFQGCTSLTRVVIPESITCINDYTFYNCTSLTSVVIPESVTEIGQNSFRGCTSLTSISIPNSVTWIDHGAFYGCTSLTRVVIPESVTMIIASAFSSCTSLNNITVDKNNESYKSIDGNLYSKDGTTLIQYAIGKTAEIFTIPDGVTSFNSAAFQGCTSLTSIVIPESLTVVYDNPFDGCSNLINAFYEGKATNWNNVSGYGKSDLTSVIKFYSESEPAENPENYWHYVDDVPTIWAAE